MHLTLVSRKILTGIPSASGIEVMGDKLYLIGDDSPWLFRLNEKFEIEEKIRIAENLPTAGNKIPKAFKSDLEAMTAFGSDLLLFGSGSRSPQRDVLLRVNTTIPAIKKYSLVQFYKNLRTAAGLNPEELNIEAAVLIGEDLFLFNRGKNRIFRLNAQALIAYAEENSPVPALEIFQATLPSLNNIEAGFSGAAACPNQQEIVFTASVENTPNWIDDGEVLGSFAGILPLSALKDSFTPDCVVITDTKKNILKIKVESVAVHKIISPNSLLLLFVTDNDGSTSELIQANLNY